MRNENSYQKTNQLNLLEESLSYLDSKEVIISILDRLINMYKLKYMTEWEKNHNIDKSSFDRKINHLLNKKSEVIRFLESDEDIQINLTIKK